MIEVLYDLDILYEGFLNVKSTSGWKEKTQRYEMYLLPNLIDLRDSIKNGTYRPSPPQGFFISERGKPRFIESRTVNDNIVQYVVHQYMILPAIRPKIIYDNAASLENRGTSFFRHRLEYHLTTHAKTYGNDGYVLLVDFKKFFDNIQYKIFMDMLRPLISDEQALSFIEMLVYENKIDVSYMSDEEYANCMYIPFDNYAYRLAIKNEEIICTGEKYMYKGMGLGSQISQDAGIFVPHPIDNYIKIVKGVKGYGRFMDDSYTIHHSKKFLKELLYDITDIALENGIFINERKTQIVSLKHEFTILKLRYKVYPNASISIIPKKDSFVRELKKFKQEYILLDTPDSNITFKDVIDQYSSWKGNILFNNDNHYIHELDFMDEQFQIIFEKYIKEEERKNQLWKEKKENRKYKILSERLIR